MGELTVLPVPVSRPQDPAGRRRPTDEDGFDTLLATDEALVGASSTGAAGLRREESQPSKRRALGDPARDPGLLAEASGGLGASTGPSAVPVERPQPETVASDAVAVPGRGSAPDQWPAGVPHVVWAAHASAAGPLAAEVPAAGTVAPTTAVAAGPVPASPVAAAPPTELPEGLPTPETATLTMTTDLPVSPPAAEGAAAPAGPTPLAGAAPAKPGPRPPLTDAAPLLGPAGTPGQSSWTDSVEPGGAAPGIGPQPTSGSETPAQPALGRGDSPPGAALTPSSVDVVAPGRGAAPDSSAPAPPPLGPPPAAHAAPVGLQPGGGRPVAPSLDSQQLFPASGSASPAAATALPGPLAPTAGWGGPVPIRPGEVAAPAPPPPVPPPADQLAQVVTPLRGAPDGSYTLRLALRPRELGPVEVSVTMRNGTLGLVLHSDDTAAQQVLRDALGQLREALTDAGVDLGRLDVADARTGDPGTRDTGTGAGYRDAAASRELARAPADALAPAVVLPRRPDASRHRAGLDLRL